MLVHRYERPTGDLDLATAVDLAVLRRLRDELAQESGVTVELHEPDPQDPVAVTCSTPILTPIVR